MGRPRLRMGFDLRDDKTMPTGVHGLGLDSFSMLGRRGFAIDEVLGTLPEEPYQKFKSISDRIGWFMPEYRLWGSVGPMPAKPLVIYLSPILEFEQLVSDATLCGLVVHELSHAILEHGGACDFAANQAIEDEANNAARSWGFADEIDSLDLLWKVFAAKPNQATSGFVAGSGN